jgi:hypothetical protein
MVYEVSDGNNQYNSEGNPRNKGYNTDDSNDPYRFDYLHNHVHLAREGGEGDSKVEDNSLADSEGEDEESAGNSDGPKPSLIASIVKYYSTNICSSAIGTLGHHKFKEYLKADNYFETFNELMKGDLDRTSVTSSKCMWMTNH